MRESVHTRLFHRALQLRDAGDVDGAITLLQQLVDAQSATDQHLQALAQLELGHLFARRGQHAEAIASFRAATDTAPRMELASVTLFRALEQAGERVEALCEAFRFVQLRESLCYRELFSGDQFRDEASEEYELAEQTRALLEAHRNAQRRRVRPMPGDTVRVLPAAPAPLQPGALAVIRGLKGQTAHLVFSNGGLAEADIAVVDHHNV